VDYKAYNEIPNERKRTMDNTAAIAAVSAVVATGITLVVTEIRKTHNDKAHKAEMLEVDRTSHMRGWYEGRESILQQFQGAKPDDFASRA